MGTVSKAALWQNPQIPKPSNHGGNYLVESCSKDHMMVYKCLFQGLVSAAGVDLGWLV